MHKLLRRGLYDACIALLVLFYFPKYLWGRCVHKKYTRSFLYRLGLKKPAIPALSSPVIWIHAVSLGETKASVAFAHEIKKNYPNASIIVSSITETGFDEAKKSLPFAAAHFFLPFDFSFLIRPLVRKIKPDLAVFVEGDLWPNFLDALKACETQILLINGKISEKSLKRYLFFKLYARSIFNQINHACLQNGLYLDRFQQLKVPLEKLSITGNIKFDIPREELPLNELISFKKHLGIHPEHLVLVIGSTHEKEEELLLSELVPLLKKEAHLKILLAPRHPERFKQVKQLLSKYASYATWSQGSSHPDSERIVLIDTLGKLKHCYQIAGLAIVGGSFVDIGGHNLLEPSEYGVPVLFGPYVYKQTEFANLTQKEGIGFQVDVSGLLKKVTELLYTPSLKETIATQAKALFTHSKGASLKSWVEAEHLLIEKLKEKNFSDCR